VACPAADFCILRSVRRFAPAAARAATLALVLLAALAAGAQAATVRLAGTHKLGSERIVLAGDTITVSGTAGSSAGAKLTFTRAGKALKTVGLTPSAPFKVRFAVPGAGSLVIHADGSVPVLVQAINPSADIGSNGLNVRFLQAGLRRLKYGGVPLSGDYGYSTGRAMIAFRKVNDMRRTTNASSRIFHRIAAGLGAYKPRTSRLGNHVEGDLTHQVIALVKAGGKLKAVYITSSGRPALKTPTGVHRVYKQERGINSLSEYNMSYFAGICGIHGYYVVPTFPHSHCCLRVPIADSGTIRNFVTIGMAVDVFYRRRATA
jgi:hypothetical protein